MAWLFNQDKNYYGSKYIKIPDLKHSPVFAFLFALALEVSFNVLLTSLSVTKLNYFFPFF